MIYQVHERINSNGEHMPDVSVGIAGNVCTITIDRPHVRNAIAQHTMEELADALDDASRCEARILVLRGSGDRAFVSGGDLRELAALRTVSQASAMGSRMRHLLDRLASLPVPTIAALNGHALGGGAEVALACDIRIAPEDVTVAFTQSQLAIMPAWGGVERLVQQVGRSVALRLLLTGERLSSAQASNIGLVDIVTKRSEFESECHALASRIAGLPSPVSTSIKAVVQATRPNSHPTLERDSVQAFANLWASDDHWAAAAANLHAR
jgi:enoyl-CoA hydratase